MSTSTPRQRRRLLAGLVVLAAGALVAVVAPAAAGARPSHPARHDTGYLALGDSVAFGYRPPEVTVPTAYANPTNFGSYAEDVAGFDSLRITNASCPGETSASMISAHAQSNGCENSIGSATGYRTTFPLHVQYTGTQLAFAVQFLRAHPDTRLVSIDIGANDVFVCQQTTADHCTGADFPAALAQISANLTTALRALRHDAHYRRSIVVLSYYSLSYTDRVQVAGSKALNQALAEPTKQFGGVIADGFTAFRLASRAAGGDPCAAGLLVPLGGGTCNIHPSPYGHAVLAGAIQHVIDQRED